MKVEVNGARLFFDVDGTELAIEGDELVARPTLILLHGSPGNSDHSVFRPMFSELTDVARVIYLDMCGSGRSDKSPDGTYSLERWADDLVEFCDRLGIDHPIVLGNSAGGMVAGTYAIRHPHHALKLVLSSSQARLDPQRCLEVFERLGGPAARQAAHEALVGVGDAASFAAYAEQCLPFYNPTPQSRVSHTIFRRSCFDAFHRLGGIWHTMDFLADLDAVRCPTLVLAGVDDPVTPIEDSDDMVAHLDPNVVRYERIENAGHGVWLDGQARAFAILRDFITQV